MDIRAGLIISSTDYVDYRTLIKQRLLVEFSYKLPTLNPILRDLLPCAIICYCDKWLPQHSGSLSIITGAEASCFLSEKELNMVGSSIDT